MLLEGPRGESQDHTAHPCPHSRVPRPGQRAACGSRQKQPCVETPQPVPFSVGWRGGRAEWAWGQPVCDCLPGLSLSISGKRKVSGSPTGCASSRPVHPAAVSSPGTCLLQVPSAGTVITFPQPSKPEPRTSRGFDPTVSSAVFLRLLCVLFRQSWTSAPSPEWV